MDFNELLQKDLEQLMTLLSEKRALLRELRFKIREGQLKNVKAIKPVRQEIAQIATAITRLKKQS
ncbi:MAG: 50S ribosomal protein L29 [Candidatus Magasanikbacteria bacterium RIFCSPHIGHO2_02_FULL_41_13]|jgi:ribosomal protein L29|uniref:Large ribosomal subunit protein uL29 n=1 Tax=Candidatus Magasanikbacteria bacterium RIFCSPHIGHO2_02_FULL_41_13 TaxID=1798676 RepID=A0A1F6M4H7_9BACT|nr:MAG: 50S ribosomal protein L29 [Candidatus Magasanikbacteria bacterium RIFCSPHIGHO2_02_FULL_41_13]